MKPNHLTQVVDQLLREPRPVSDGLVEVPEPGATPIEAAFTGLCLAINAVLKADHAIQLRDWEERREKLLDWRAHLMAHPIPDAKAASLAIGSDDMDVSTALFGTNRWREMLTAVEEMMQWAGERNTESARKRSIVSQAFGRAVGIRRRGDERVEEIRRRSERKIKKLDPGDDEGRERVIAAGESEVQTVSTVAVNRTNAVIRQSPGAGREPRRHRRAGVAA
ncbi:MAG: hypothetical protein K2X52_27935 [Mycobacteriaceae bacterium]|nr:hypothetical protein [Mycobacteriaceae bacterium]